MNYRRMRGLSGGSMVNGVYVTDSPITTDTVLASGVNVYTDSTGTIIGTGSSSQSLTQWLNANSTTVMLGAGALVLVLLLTKAGR